MQLFLGAVPIILRLFSKARGHLLFSNYSRNNLPKPSHRPPEELSSSDEDTSESEEEEMVEDFRRRDRARGRGRWPMRRFAVRGRGGGNFRGGFRGRFMRGRGRGRNSRGGARGYRGRRW